MNDSALRMMFYADLKKKVKDELIKVFQDETDTFNNLTDRAVDIDECLYKCR